MNDERNFGVIVRALGLFGAAYGLIELLGALFPAVGYRPGDYIVHGLPTSVVGLVMLLRADWFVAIAYGSRYASEEHPDDSDPPSK